MSRNSSRTVEEEPDSAGVDASGQIGYNHPDSIPGEETLGKDMSNNPTSNSPLQFVLDLDGRITEINPPVERTTGYRMSDLVGLPFVSLVYFEDLPEVKGRWRLAMVGDCGDYEVRILGKYGEVHLMRSRSRPRFAEGRIVGITEEMTDITQPSEN